MVSQWANLYGLHPLIRLGPSWSSLAMSEPVKGGIEQSKTLAQKLTCASEGPSETLKPACEVCVGTDLSSARAKFILRNTKQSSNVRCFRNRPCNITQIHGGVCSATWHMAREKTHVCCAPGLSSWPRTGVCCVESGKRGGKPAFEMIPRLPRLTESDTAKATNVLPCQLPSLTFRGAGLDHVPLNISLWWVPCLWTARYLLTGQQVS